MMKPYYEITDNEQDRGIFQTKFPDYNKDVRAPSFCYYYDNMVTVYVQFVLCD